jgi:hypothetical protein
MRSPLDNFSMLFEKFSEFVCRLRCASNASMLVLIRNDMRKKASYARLSTNAVSVPLRPSSAGDEET